MNGDPKADPTAARGEMLRLVHRVRTPAGNDPRFSSLASIQEHGDEFVKAANQGMKELHREAVHWLMWIEERLDGVALGSEEAQGLLLWRLLWRHVNNHLAWMCLHDRHIVRRLCGFKPRPELRRSNPNAIIQILDQVAADPYHFALWTDTTSFIDIGDILLHSPVHNKWQLIEAKQWGDIAWLFQSDAPKERIEAFDRAMSCDVGKSAAVNTGRLRRQLSRMRKAEEVIQNDIGTDPFDPAGQRRVLIKDLGIQEEHFHSEISNLISKARIEGSAVTLIDDCLWVGAYRGKEPNMRHVFAGSAACVFCPDPGPGFIEFCEYALRETKLYTQMAGHPLALPVFMMQVPDQDVLDLISDGIRIRMFLHWEAWAEHLAANGGSFRWLSLAEYRKTKTGSQVENPDVVDQRVPCVSFGPVEFVPPSSQMIRIFTDFLRPSTMADVICEWAEFFRETGAETL